MEKNYGIANAPKMIFKGYKGEFTYEFNYANDVFIENYADSFNNYTDYNRPMPKRDMIIVFSQVEDDDVNKLFEVGEMTICLEKTVRDFNGKDHVIEETYNGMRLSYKMTYCRGLAHEGGNIIYVFTNADVKSGYIKKEVNEILNRYALNNMLNAIGSNRDINVLINDKNINKDTVQEEMKLTVDDFTSKISKDDIIDIGLRKNSSNNAIFNCFISHKGYIRTIKSDNIDEIVEQLNIPLVTRIILNSSEESFIEKLKAHGYRFVCEM